MKENKKLQQKLKEEFETPETPFEEWAAQRGVLSARHEPAREYELADNVNGRGVGDNRKRKIWLFCAPLLAALVALSVLLACFLPRSSATNLPNLYGANDTERVGIDLNELTAQKDIYLFDLSEVVDIGSVNKDVLKKGNSKTMLYTLDRCLLAVGENTTADAFYITYRIRTYAYYEFVRYTDFSELDKVTTIHDKKIDYTIVDFTRSTAYAKFVVGKYEYFIEAHGFQGVTELNEDNFLNLLDKILI